MSFTRSRIHLDRVPALLPQFWVGGGLGSVHASAQDESSDGFGFDVRAGVTLPTTTKNAFSIRIDAMPAILDSTFTGVSMMVGYQYL